MKISFDLKALDNLRQNLDKLSKDPRVPFSLLFPSSFMKKYTQFNSIDEMVNKSPFKVESEEDFKKIPDKDWDVYVIEKTSFKSWGEMKSKAGEEYIGKQIHEALKKL